MNARERRELEERCNFVAIKAIREDQLAGKYPAGFAEKDIDTILDAVNDRRRGDERQPR